MNNNLYINENAKDDWMKVVKKHSRKQKGLPALTRMNTNAGNVEHNVAMFNKMHSFSEGPINNPVSGPFGGNISSTGGETAMGESLDNCVEDMSMRSEDVVELEYDNLPVEVVTRRGNPSGYYSVGFGNWLPDDDETEVIRIDWTYRVDKDSVIEFLQDYEKVQNDPEMINLTDDEYEKKLEDDFDTLLDKYMDAVLAHFRRGAEEDAEENYEYDEDPFYYEESLTTCKDVNLDDKFDMSMRTLL